MQIARQHSIAITWTSQSCHAVRFGVLDDGAVMLKKVWKGVLGQDGDSVAELVVTALRVLEADENIYIVAGGSGDGWSMTDITMPNLPAEELRAALQFEIRKQTPLPMDKLCWGYRIVRKNGTGRNALLQLRLYYLKQENWSSWLKNISGMGHLDALMPAPVALDPLLSGRTVTMPPYAEHALRFSYRSIKDGAEREIVPCDEAHAPDFASSLPLPEEQNWNLKELDALDEKEKQAFIPALILGIYALMPQLTADAESGFAIPEHFRAHRHIALKLGAAALGLYLLGLMVFCMAGCIHTKSSAIRQVETEITKIKDELSELRKFTSGKEYERINSLMSELKERNTDAPDFPTVLLELTRIIEPPAWVSQSIEWHDAKVTLLLQAPDHNSELVERMEDSPVLGDVGERLSSYSQSSGMYMRRFEMVARYDTKEETESRRLLEEKLKKLQEEQAAAQKAAAEAEGDSENDAAAEEDASSDKSAGNGEGEE